MPIDEANPLVCPEINTKDLRKRNFFLVFVLSLTIDAPPIVNSRRMGGRGAPTRLKSPALELCGVRGFVV